MVQGQDYHHFYLHKIRNLFTQILKDNLINLSLTSPAINKQQVWEAATEFSL